jgi:hypothetical protein
MPRCERETLSCTNARPNTGLGVPLGMVGFHEEPALIAEDSRLDQQHVRDALR